MVYYDTVNHGTDAEILANASSIFAGQSDQIVISGLQFSTTYYFWARWEIGTATGPFSAVQSGTTSVIPILTADSNSPFNVDGAGNLAFAVGGDSTTLDFTVTNELQNKLVATVGTGPGLYMGFVNMLGVTDHVKTIFMYFLEGTTDIDTSSSPADPPTTGYIYPANSGIDLRPTDFDLTGAIADNRLTSTTETGNMVMAFRYTGSEDVNFYVRGEADSATDSITVEARFIKLPI